MCRLYGLRSNEPTKVECTLVHTQNALMAQSRRDLVGKSHPHGWGIGTVDGEEPRIERRATAAFDDLHFSVTAERVFARTVLAHVRLATVGKISPDNTHPFAHRGWMFAHNGTVTAFDRVRPVLEEETAADLRRRRGTTDSELLFRWLLSRMADAGIDLDGGGVDLPRLSELVGGSIARVAELCARAGEEKPAKLNVILTDGEVLVATRWKRTLHWLARDGLHDCEICGIPHVHHRDGTDYRAAIVASEPISRDEPWQEVPEGAVVAVDREIRAGVERI